MSAVSILIPGILGSELRLGNDLIWPGPVRNLFSTYQMMEQLLDPNLIATDVIRSYAFSKQYQALIDDLAILNFIEEERTLFVFPYDWRKANELAAEKLADLLDKVLEFQGTHAEINLIAHSMGGLVARCYLESGLYSDRPAFAYVRRLITLGTPHRGSPLALIRILGQEKVIWLNAAQIKQLANDPRYPSAYQLLPPASEIFAWNDDFSADLPGLDPYTPEGIQALGLTTAGMRAARDFHAQLDSTRRPAHVRYFCFSGTQQTTVSFAACTLNGVTWEVRKVERDSAGDGTVPFWSSTLPGIQSFAVGGEHSVIYRDRELRRTLAAVLGQAGTLGPLPFDAVPSPDIDVTVRDRVVSPKVLFRLVLTPRNSLARVDGELRIEQAEDATQNSPTFVPYGPPIKISYAGPLAESIGLLLNAPQQPGGYRLAYYNGSDPIPTGSDELFVQS